MSAASGRRKSAKRKGISVEEKLRRRGQRGDGVVAHGICRICSRRTFLVLPARWCAPCLQQVLENDDYERPTPEQVLAAIDEEFGEND